MAEKILKKIKELWEKLVNWWTSFPARTKTLIVTLAVGVIVAFVILYAAITAPNFTLLQQCDSTKEASQVTAVLDEANIEYKISDDALQIKVPQKDLATAKLTLSASGIATTGLTIEDVLKPGLMVTEADKEKKYTVYLEDKLENYIEKSFPAIKAANVVISIPDNDGTLLSKKEEPFATVGLSYDGDFDEANAEFIAKAVATALHASNADHIIVMDFEANLLYSGDDMTSAVGNASSQLGVKADAESMMNAKVRNVLASELGDVKVATNLIIDFSTTEKTNHQYTPADGQSQGLLSEESNYTSDSAGGTAGPPGTDSNSETTYYYQDNDYTSSTIEEYYKKYLPNEYVEYTTIPAGSVVSGQSSCAVSSTKYIVVKEDDVKAQGLLDGVTWDEYKLANSEPIPIEIPEETINLVSNASGIPTSNITVVAHAENFFVDSEGLGIDIYDVLQIALIVIILVLLAVVVIKSMSTEKPTEEAEELSVENLLQSNPESVMDNIEVEESSETKKLIEKFVDENPEAAANLLRNWLNEEWG